MFDYTALKGFIAMYFGTKKKFGEFLGIGHDALYNKLSNKNNFTQREIMLVEKKICEVGAPFTIYDLFFTTKIRKNTDIKKT